MSWQKSPLTSSTRPAARRWGLPACQDKIYCGEGAHASRGLAGPHGAENGHSGIEAALRDNEPSRVARFDGFDRVIDLPDNAARSRRFYRQKGARGQQFEGGQIAQAPRLKTGPARP